MYVRLDKFHLSSVCGLIFDVLCEYGVYLYQLRYICTQYAAQTWWYLSHGDSGNNRIAMPNLDNCGKTTVTTVIISNAFTSAFQCGVRVCVCLWVRARSCRRYSHIQMIVILYMVTIGLLHAGNYRVWKWNGAKSSSSHLISHKKKCVTLAQNYFHILRIFHGIFHFVIH